MHHTLDYDSLHSNRRVLMMHIECPSMDTNLDYRWDVAAFAPILASIVSLALLLLKILWAKCRRVGLRKAESLTVNQGDPFEEAAAQSAPITCAYKLRRTPRTPSVLYWELLRAAAVAASFAISLVPVLVREGAINSSIDYCFQIGFALSCVSDQLPYLAVCRN